MKGLPGENVKDMKVINGWALANCKFSHGKVSLSKIGLNWFPWGEGAFTMVNGRDLTFINGDLSSGLREDAENGQWGGDLTPGNS